jgi:predicted thioesterase
MCGGGEGMTSREFKCLGMALKILIETGNIEGAKVVINIMAMEEDEKIEKKDKN